MLDIITLASGAGGVITDNLMFHLDAGNAESYGDQTLVVSDVIISDADGNSVLSSGPGSIEILASSEPFDEYEICRMSVFLILEITLFFLKLFT